MTFSMPFLLVGVAAISSAASSASAAPPSLQRPVRSILFDIHGGTLSGALLAFGRQAGLRIVFSGVALRGKKAKPLIGRFKPEEGIKLLLQGSGFTFKIIGGGVAVHRLRAYPVKGSDPPPRPVSPVQPLPLMPLPEVEDVEILVTARRRPEQIVHVPISMTVVPSSTYFRNGGASLPDLGVTVPNVVVADPSLSSRLPISTRGVYSNVRSLGFEDSFGVFIDGVSVGSRQNFNLGLFDVDHLEVVRGPQGVYLGRSTISGALNIVSNKPGTEPSLVAVLGAGNLGMKSLRLAIDRPILGQSALGRAFFSRYARDGTTRNLAGGYRLDNENALIGRVALRLKMKDVLADLAIDHLQEDRYIAPGELVSGPGSDARPYTVAYDHVPNREERRITGGAVQVNYQIAQGAILDLSLSKRRSSTALKFDQDFSARPLLHVDFRDRQDITSAEVRATLGSSPRRQTVIGAYGLWQRSSYHRLAFAGSDVGPGVTEVDGDVDIRSLSIFGGGEYRLAARLYGFLGARLTVERKELRHSQDGSTFGLPSFNVQGLRRNDQAITPHAGLRYELSDNSMLYGSVTKGFKGSGFNADFVSDEGSLFSKPETALSYEIGFKKNFRKRVRLAAAAYYMRYHDLQIAVFDQGGWKFRNVSQWHASGGELDATVQVSPKLKIRTGVGFTATELGRGVSPDLRLARAPKWTLALSADYTKSVTPSHRLVAQSDITYRSAQYSNSINPEWSRLPGFAALNASIGIEAEHSQWSVRAWGRNLTNQTVPSDAYVQFKGNSLLEGHVVTYASPRTYGIEFTRRF